MLKKTTESNYKSHLRKFKGLKLSALLIQFPLSGKLSLLLDLLSEKVDALLPFIEAESDKAERLIYSPAELAYRILLQLPAEWFQSHTSILEKIYIKVLEDASLSEQDKEKNIHEEFGDQRTDSFHDKTEQASFILEKVKHLIALKEAGLSKVFFKKHFLNSDIKPKERMELLILSCKIDQGDESFDIENWVDNVQDLVNDSYKIWQNIDIERSDSYKKKNMEYGLMLDVLKLYIFKEFDPGSAVNKTLLQWFSINQKPPEWAIIFVKNYFLQALYKFLTSSIYRYEQFSLIQEEVGIIWKKSLIEETLNHPTMNKIKENYTNYKESGQLPEIVLDIEKIFE